MNSFKVAKPKNDIQACVTGVKKLFGKVCSDPQEKYFLLKERDMFLNKARNVDLGAVIKGTMQEMCSEKERYSRMMSKSTSKYETTDDLFVKDYARSAADQDLPLPHELRPINILMLTMDYLTSQIIDKVPIATNELVKWYEFVWSRTRAIRKDITQQRLVNTEVVDILERCIRFHIYAGYKLSPLEATVFDIKMNIENLGKCVQSLRHCYDDLAKKDIFCKNEAEFRAYDVLVNMEDSGVASQASHYRLEIRRHKLVLNALAIANAYHCEEYKYIFKLVKSETTTFLQACLVHGNFLTIRVKLLVNLATACSKLPLDINKLSGIFEYEDNGECLKFLQDHGCSVIKMLPQETTVDIKSVKHNYNIRSSYDPIVENKLTKSIAEVISGKALTDVVPPKAIISFDAEDRYMKDPIALQFIFEMTGEHFKPSTDLDVKKPKKELKFGMNTASMNEFSRKSLGSTGLMPPEVGFDGKSSFKPSVPPSFAQHKKAVSFNFDKNESFIIPNRDDLTQGNKEDNKPAFSFGKNISNNATSTFAFKNKPDDSTSPFGNNTNNSTSILNKNSTPAFGFGKNGTFGFNKPESSLTFKQPGTISNIAGVENEESKRIEEANLQQILAKQMEENRLKEEMERQKKLVEEAERRRKEQEELERKRREAEEIARKKAEEDERKRLIAKTEAMKQSLTNNIVNNTLNKVVRIHSFHRLIDEINEYKRIQKERRKAAKSISKIVFNNLINDIVSPIAENVCNVLNEKWSKLAEIGERINKIRIERRAKRCFERWVWYTRWQKEKRAIATFKDAVRNANDEPLKNIVNRTKDLAFSKPLSNLDYLKARIIRIREWRSERIAKKYLMRWKENARKKKEYRLWREDFVSIPVINPNKIMLKNYWKQSTKQPLFRKRHNTQEPSELDNPKKFHFSTPVTGNFPKTPMILLSPVSRRV